MVRHNFLTLITLIEPNRIQFRSRGSILYYSRTHTIPYTMRFGAIIRRGRHFSSKLRTKERLDVENAFPKRGLEVLKSFRESSKFDESVDVALRLNLDPRKPNQAVRKQVRLPHGTSSLFLCLQMFKFVKKNHI